jgi:small subunit ribosomal protein S6
MALRYYEGLFLFDSAEASKDLAATLGHVRTILEKYGSKVMKLEKWDDRKLAYDIGTIKRGTYVLAYFQGDHTQNPAMRREIELSEHIVRHLILHDPKLVEHLEERERVKKKREQEAAQAAAEGFPLEGERGRYGDRPRFSRDRDRDRDRDDRPPRRERAPAPVVAEESGEDMA